CVKADRSCVRDREVVSERRRVGMDADADHAQLRPRQRATGHAARICRKRGSGSLDARPVCALYELPDRNPDDAGLCREPARMTTPRATDRKTRPTLTARRATRA